MKYFSCFIKQLLGFIKILLISLSFVSVSNAWPVFDTALTTAVGLGNGLLGTMDGNLAKISGEVTTMNTATQRMVNTMMPDALKLLGTIDGNVSTINSRIGLMTPSSLAGVVTPLVIPNVSDIGFFKDPDGVLGDAAAAKEYSRAAGDIDPAACASGNKAGAAGMTTSVGRGFQGTYSGVAYKACQRVQNLRAYRAKIAERYTDDMQKLQKEVEKIALTGPTTLSAAAKDQVALQTLLLLEGTLTGEYKGKIDTIDSLIVIAIDMRDGASKSIVEGAPSSTKMVIATQLAKAAVGFAINSGTTFGTAYNP